MAFEILDSNPSSRPSMGSGEVHIYRAGLDLPQRCMEDLKGKIAEEELRRADQFHFDEDRDRYIARRGMLRLILSLYTGIDPCELRFHYGRHGKPALDKGPESEGFRFNLSHSGGLCVIALSRDSEVGIDIEQIRRDIPVEKVAEKFFTSREHTLLLSLPAQLKHEAFFIWWTCKEAYAKARGHGLSIPLSDLDVSFATDEQSAATGFREQHTFWALQKLSVGPGVAGALVTKGEQKVVKSWQLV